MTPQYEHNPKSADATALSTLHMRARASVIGFAVDEQASITVDWTVLSGVAVSLALGTAGVMSDVTGMLSNNMGNELRDRDLSATAMGLDNEHFAPMVNAGLMSEADAEALYDAANGQMNNYILTQLDAGIDALEAGTLTAEEMAELLAIASVAYQRNLVPDAALDHYFGFDSGGAPYLACNQGAGVGEGAGCIMGTAAENRNENGYRWRN